LTLNIVKTCRPRRVFTIFALPKYMATILCIETATPICSMSLVQNGTVIYLEETEIHQSHTASLMEFINHSLQTTGKILKGIDAIAVSKGPGSYTGLRIGISTAKGLCYALDIPLIGIVTLKSMAIGMKKICQSEDLPILFCPMIDARRMEVYTTLYDYEINNIVPVTASIIDESSFTEVLSGNIVYFGGDGAGKCKHLLEANPNARFLDQEVVSAANLSLVSETAYKNGLFENVAYFEPNYLKDFIPGKSRVKGLY
jgi:tRNA threonylcarbamoyladenosine biosynthesis protein TsaB